VQTAVTAPALVEFLKEFRGMAGKQPVTPEELAFSKAFLTQGYPADFETPAQIALHLETVVGHRLPEDCFNTYVPRIKAVSDEEVANVAKKYLDLDHLTIVIIADRAKVEPSLRELPLGVNIELVQFDDDLHLVPADSNDKP
jgi:zinc protease